MSANHSTRTSARPSVSVYHSRNAVLERNLLEVTRSEARSLSVRRGAVSVATSAAAMALFAEIPQRQARRLAAKYSHVAYAVTLLPHGWRWSA